MPQSLSNVLVHVIYSTKNREPFLRDVRLRRELEAYLVGTLQRIECPPCACEPSPTICMCSADSPEP